jgi:hypothetical protein
MKKLILLIIIVLFNINTYAQDNETYAQLREIQAYNGVYNTTLCLGTMGTDSLNRIIYIVPPLDKMHFLSAVDAMNYLSKYGFELVESYVTDNPYTNANLKQYEQKIIIYILKSKKKCIIKTTIDFKNYSDTKINY